jgi:hypothetical protein
MADPASYVAAKPALTLNGAKNDDMSTALRDIVVRAPEAGMATAELRLANWGDTASGPTDFLFGKVALGDKVEIAFGLDKQKTIFVGEVTAIEERYGDGAPQLVLIAEDALHRLARRRTLRAFAQKSPNAIVSTLAGDANLRADVRLSDAPGDYNQLNESDLAFLRRLAARYGARPRVLGSTLVCRKREALGQPVALDAGDTLRRVRVVADLARQPIRAFVNGEDLAAGAPISATGDSLLVPASGPTAASTLRGLGWDGDDIFAFPPPATQTEASDFANAALDQHGRRFLHGDLVCDGNPDVLVGAAVALKGVATRLTGTYAVVACAHVFNEATGYQTYARIERADSG